jgi:acyl-ACP thioesterase
MASGRPSRIPAGFDELYGEAHGGRRVKARLDHPDPPAGGHDGFDWPLRFTDFDVLGHVNNAACWQIVEEAMSERRDLRAPLNAEVQHRTAIERDATVEVAVASDGGALTLWVRASGAIAMTARVEPR